LNSNVGKAKRIRTEPNLGSLRTRTKPEPQVLEASIFFVRRIPRYSSKIKCYRPKKRAVHNFCCRFSLKVAKQRVPRSLFSFLCCFFSFTVFDLQCFILLYNICVCHLFNKEIIWMDVIFHYSGKSRPSI